jgi:hypothetical protein
MCVAVCFFVHPYYVITTIRKKELLPISHNTPLHPKVTAEEQYLAEKWGPEFEAYKQNVPGSFLPSVKKLVTGVKEIRESAKEKLGEQTGKQWRGEGMRGKKGKNEKTWRAAKCADIAIERRSGSRGGNNRNRTTELD